MNSREVMWALIHRVQKFRPRGWFAAVPNVSWGLLPWEADILFCSKAGYLTEIEVKVSRSDWIADFTKRKWRWFAAEQQWIKQFYYAAPKELAERYAEIPGLPPWAGVIACDTEQGSKILREARIEKNARKLTEKEMFQLARLASLKFWSHFKIEKHNKKEEG